MSIFTKYPQFGEYLRKARENVGLTQEEVAEQLDVESSVTISNWENGKTQPGKQGGSSQHKRIVELYKLDWHEYAIAYMSDLFSEPDKNKENVGLSDNFPDFLFLDEDIDLIKNLYFTPEETELLTYITWSNHDWTLGNRRIVNRSVLSSIPHYIKENGQIKSSELLEKIWQKFFNSSTRQYMEPLEPFVAYHIEQGFAKQKIVFSIYDANNEDLVQLAKILLSWHVEKAKDTYEYVPEFSHIVYAIDKIQNNIFLVDDLAKENNIFNPFVPIRFDKELQKPVYPHCNEMEDYISNCEWIGSSKKFQEWVIVDHEVKKDEDGDEYVFWKEGAKLTEKGQQLAEFIKEQDINTR